MTRSPDSSAVPLSAALLGLGLLLAVRWMAAPPAVMNADPTSGLSRPETSTTPITLQPEN